MDNISNEIKAKIYGQYLGCNIRIPDDGTAFFIEELAGVQLSTRSGLTDGYLTLEGSGYHFADEKLILKPLSAISDEDAIEVAKMKYHNFKHHEPSSWIKHVKKFYLERSNFISPLIFQFLQSKGYDLPQYLLGGKTLYQAELAVYSEKVVINVSSEEKQREYKGDEDKTEDMGIIY